MRTYECPVCSSRLYFNNLTCRCGHALCLEPLTDAFIQTDRACRNRSVIGCNWTAAGDEDMCLSCAMTRVHPKLSDEYSTSLWARAEAAKRWSLAGLLRWGWFRSQDPDAAPAFHLLSERTPEGKQPIMMGHAAGKITINVMEASDATRAQRQESLSERYRTMIGHFRHEIAHFLFYRLSADAAFLAAFRDRFGDERADYGEALASHYADPSEIADKGHITTYAMAHPHEDWAETAAHLMHIIDLLDSAQAVGLQTAEPWPVAFDPYLEPDTDMLVSRATEISLAVNHVNRALDLPDLYPFVLSPTVRDKLAFVHGWLRQTTDAGVSGHAA